MNSVHAELALIDETIGKVKRQPINAVNLRALRDLATRRNNLIRDVGPVGYGPELPRDLSRWSMTRQEWAGQG